MKATDEREGTDELAGTRMSVGGRADEHWRARERRDMSLGASAGASTRGAAPRPDEQRWSLCEPRRAISRTG